MCGNSLYSLCSLYNCTTSPALQAHWLIGVRCIHYCIVITVSLCIYDSWSLGKKSITTPKCSKPDKVLQSYFKHVSFSHAQIISAGLCRDDLVCHTLLTVDPNFYLSPPLTTFPILPPVSPTPSASFRLFPLDSSQPGPCPHPPLSSAVFYNNLLQLIYKLCRFKIM